MSARLLLEVALRVLGMWFLFHSVNTLTLTVSSYLATEWTGWGAYLVGYAVTIVIQGALGVVLLYFAPNIARRFYPAVTENRASNDTSIRIGPGDIYRTACFVLGVYLLVQTAEPGTRLVIAAIRRPQSVWMPGEVASTAVTLVVYAVAGTLLVFGSRPISELLSNLRYDPETIPKQQVSLAILLVLFVIIATVITILRRMA